jgi:hypothetical protein
VESEHPQHPPGTSRGAEAPPLHRIKRFAGTELTDHAKGVRGVLADIDALGSQVHTFERCFVGRAELSHRGDFKSPGVPSRLSDDDTCMRPKDIDHERALSANPGPEHSHIVFSHDTTALVIGNNHRLSASLGMGSHALGQVLTSSVAYDSRVTPETDWPRRYVTREAAADTRRNELRRPREIRLRATRRP